MTPKSTRGEQRHLVLPFMSPSGPRGQLTSLHSLAALAATGKAGVKGDTQGKRPSQEAGGQGEFSINRVSE